ncbi:hypothetical protein BJY01DRAFT_108964 [Aspergillus pseudoustus]|uniref:F-box domain-containing protein n=1 Tax=Aspergillus pseudoustus TaxID=1810923 RepID=A0ABR4IWQ0_9EURO
MSITTNGLVPLPLEILQTILILLDFESFHLASRTCRLWRNAALSTAILRRQLLSVPALGQSTGLIRDATAKEIRALYYRVCRDNLIGILCGIEYTEIVRSKDRATRIGDIPVRSAHGVQSSAHLRGLTLILDPSSSLTSACKTREIQLSPMLYPSADTVKQIASHAHPHARSFFRTHSFARIEVAVSRCGGLVAVALGQKLHIYAAQARLGKQQRQQEHVEVEVSENIHDSIQSVEFTDGDELLRCEIDSVGGSYVRYLGRRRWSCYHRPDAKAHEPRPAVITPAKRLRYWRAALQNLYLDSGYVESQLGGGGVSVRGMRAVRSTPAQREGEACVCRCQTEKYFFALLREGSCERRYVLGRIISGDEDDGVVEIVQRIPSRRGGAYLPETLDPITLPGPLPRLGMQLDRWDTRNLPRAHSPDPVLNISDDGRILAVFEPPHGQSEGVIYICAADYDALIGDSTAPCVVWPFALCGLGHELDALDVSKDEGAGGYIVTAPSHEKLLQWRMRGC